MSRRSRQFYPLFCTVLLGAALGVLEASSCHNPALAESSEKKIGKNGGISLQIYVDRAENKAFVDAQADGGVQGFVYDFRDSSPTRIIVEPADKDLMSVWKGNGAISQANAGDAYYWWTVEPAQFAPVLLVVEAENVGNKVAQIVSAYLDVADSSVDLQPFLITYPIDTACSGKVEEPDMAFGPSFHIGNLGWGAVDASNLTFGFRNKTSSPVGVFTVPVGDFDRQTTVSVLDALKASGLNVDRVAKEKFACDSDEHTERCVAKLAKTGIFGQLKGAIFADYLLVDTTVSGTLDYRWTDSQGANHSRQSPFSVDVPLLQFNYEGPECGGAGPVERGYKTVELGLDRKNYRIPLAYSGDVKPHQQRRFALALVADKSSQHAFRVILELADGTTVSSPPIDLLYFMPRFPQIN